MKNIMVKKEYFIIKTGKTLLKKILSEIRMRELDRLYDMMFCSSFSLFPPSFYFRHLPAEIQKITALELVKLTEIYSQIDDYA